jgi:hypothetical protein
MYAGHRPSRVDLSTVDALGAVLAARRRAEDVTGPGLLVRPVLADLEAVRSLDKHARADRVRQALGRLAAEHAQFLGWMASDLGDHRDATAWYSRALRLAHQLDEPLMTVSIRSMSSQLAVTRGQAPDARARAEGGWQHGPVGAAAKAAQVGAATGSAQTWRELSVTRTKLEPYDREPSVRALAALLRGHVRSSPN